MTGDGGEPAEWTEPGHVIADHRMTERTVRIEFPVGADDDVPDLRE